MIVRAALVFALAASPALAQIVSYAETAGYKIARIDSQGVCFAAAELRSDAGAAMIYSYYATTAGQRWHVLSYPSSEQLPDGMVSVVVEVDGETTLSRETEARGGDFMLPFEALAEITGHEEKVTGGDEMAVSVGDGADTLRVPLSDYRAALEVIQACLAAL